MEMKALLITIFFSHALFAQFKSIPQIEDENLHSLAKEAIKYRFEILLNQGVFDQLKQSENSLSSMDIQIINELAIKHMKFGKQAKRFINHYKASLNKLKLSKKIHLQDYKNNITALALGLTISDTYLLAYEQFHHNKKLRKIINEGDPSIKKEKNIFFQAIKEFYSFKLRKNLLKSIKVFQQDPSNIAKLSVTNPVITRATQLIKKSYTYQLIQGNKSHFSNKKLLLLKKIQFKRIQVADSIIKLTNNLLFLGSKAFGNTVGLIQFRRGKLFYDQSFFRDIYPQLKPLDILLEKTPFRLTDRFIPGYWGHAGIYIGTKKDLEELGIWNHPIVKKFHPQILSGKNIVEALRSGVEINTIPHFSDIDDYAQLRMNEGLSRREKVQYLLSALSQIGKKYDFGFDVESSKTIVCSELHYKVFKHIPFRTTKILGRDSIDVDQVAEQAVNNKNLQVISLYIDGEKIDSSKRQEKFESLLYNYKDSDYKPILINLNKHLKYLSTL